MPLVSGINQAAIKAAFLNGIRGDEFQGRFYKMNLMAIL
jgi:hypothetical protein